MNSEKFRSLHKPDSLSQEIAVQQALKKIEQGSFVEAVLRMIILVSKSPDGKIDDREMGKFVKILTQPPFSELNEEVIAQIMREQTIMVRFNEQKAIDTLSILLKKPEDKHKAEQLLTQVLDNPEAFSSHTQAICYKIKNRLKS